MPGAPVTRSHGLRVRCGGFNPSPAICTRRGDLCSPAPDVDEDPLYAVRLALTGMLAYAAVPTPALPKIIAARPLGLIAVQRRAFDPVKMIAAPW